MHHRGAKQQEERRIKAPRGEWETQRENTEHEIQLYKAGVSLMWCWSHDRREESERISIYDSVCGQMWSCTHMLLLFICIYIMFALMKMSNAFVNAVFCFFLKKRYLGDSPCHLCSGKRRQSIITL